ncbi:hypothetical protein HELRODRAFT_194267 [Helobdella robusta]|uniref:Uncharacterized protein n=1 Tax=Helobdella robusta TaxID=6412 RepID=T1FVV7_HELRO|nr:hypothetical protein HELRODRAFT_194267 [Helobdella robusta]ESN92305.1 hypothetical protein HELRODRAFT_194267 [Helobdella robusta]
MDDVIERKMTKLPVSIQSNLYGMVDGLYKQEETTMIAFIADARRSLKLTNEELKDEQQVLSLTSKKLTDERQASAKKEKQRQGTISARHRQKSAGGAGNLVPLEQEVFRVLSARSAARSASARGLEADHDPNHRVPTPLQLFDISDSRANEPARTLRDEDFKEERDEIMMRMSKEQSKLEMDKQRQATMLKEKMNKMATKHQETEMKASEMIREASKIEELQQTDKEKQEQKIKEKLEERKMKSARKDNQNEVNREQPDRATPFVIEVQPKN